MENEIPQDSKLLPLYLSLDGSDNSFEMGKELSRVISNLVDTLDLVTPFEGQEGGSFDDVLQQWLSFCRQHNKTCILLVDECEILHRLETREVIALNNLLINNTDILKVIIAGTRSFFNDTRPAFINFSDFFQKKYIGHFDLSDIESLIKQTKDATTKIKISRDSIENIIKNCGGHPYLIQLSCSRLFEGRGKKMKSVDLGTFAIDQGLDNFFRIDYDSLNETQHKILLHITKYGKSSRVQIEKSCQINNGNFISAIAELAYLGIVRYEADQFEINYSYFSEWIAANKFDPEKMGDQTAGINVVTLCAHSTLDYLVDFRLNCLDILRDKGLIYHWDTSQIEGGEIIDLVTKEKIEAADIIIGLICPMYFNTESDTYSYHKIAMGLGRKFIPIIAKTGYYDLYADIMDIGRLPIKDSEVLAIDSWENKNEAWSQITAELYRIIT